jgi:uncharacterized membrane protein
MGSLIVAALFFVGIHWFIAGTELRWKITAKIGEEAFQIIFSLLSLFGIFWLARVYRHAPYVALWGPVGGLRPLALVVMLIAFFLVVLAFTSPNPTAVRGGALLKEKDPAKGIQRITRHPFLWGVLLWSLTHLALNGDLDSVIFFSAFLLITLRGPASIDRKRKKLFGDDWDRFAAVTSNLPFQAILERRNSLNFAELGWWRLILAVVLYGFFLHMHQTFFGVSPLPV